jgi:hypothetical protein
MATRTHSGRRKGASSPKAKTDASSKARKKPSPETMRKRLAGRKRREGKPSPTEFLRKLRDGSIVSEGTHSAAVDEIKNVARTLTSVHAVSIALRLALEGQNAEHDDDIAVCIRLQVTNVLYDVIERLTSVGRSLGGTFENPLK